MRKLLKNGKLPISSEIHFKIYFYCLIGLSVGVVLGRIVILVSVFIGLLNWLVEANFKEKIKKLKQSPATLIFLSIYLVHIIGMFYTEDPRKGKMELETKVPFLAYPIVMLTSQQLNQKQIRQIIDIFLSVVFGVTLLSIIKYLINQDSISDIREISIFMSHIRFSLIIVFSIFSILYFLLNKQTNTQKKYIYIAALCWFTFYLFFLQSFSGIVIFFIISSFLLIFYVKKINNLFLRLCLYSLGIAVFLISFSFITRKITDFYTIKDLDVNNLPQFTKNNNPYQHNYPKQKIIENGHYIYNYLCLEELKREWNKRSKINYTGKDLKNQTIKYTLIRYLTSKGLPKDSLGVSLLTAQDIKNIEKGYTNYLYTSENLRKKIYNTLWQIDIYLKTGDVNNASITQRIEFVKVGIDVIKEHFWFGVGTGGIKKAMARQYNKTKTKLLPKNQKKIHNQYLTFWALFGVVGFIVIFGALLFPYFKLKKHKKFLPSLILTITLLSMINEDTLQSYVGVNFFIFFYCLFLFAQKNEILKK